MKTFEKAIKMTPDVATGFQSGLMALGQYRSKISVHDTRLIGGSVDIDFCTTQKYPNDNRWDYAFAYNKEVFFIEVHSANTAEVKTVLRKFQWLKDWLNQQAPEIDKLKAKSQQPFYWIQSKNFKIPTNTPQYRSVISAGLKPISKLEL
jgi:hypothetical protein